MNPGETAHQAARGDTVKRLGRFGFAARATVFLLLGIVTLLIAFAGRQAEPDQKGALAQLAGHWYGLILLWIVFFGLLAFVLWCFIQAAVGVVGKPGETLPRIEQFISGCVYGSLAASAFTLAIHAHTSSQARQQSTFTGQVMSHTGGRWAVGVVGLIILGAGLVMAYDGIRRKFQDDLNTTEMDAATQRTVAILG